MDFLLLVFLKKIAMHEAFLALSVFAMAMYKTSAVPYPTVDDIMPVEEILFHSCTSLTGFNTSVSAATASGIVLSSLSFFLVATQTL